MLVTKPPVRMISRGQRLAARQGLYEAVMLGLTICEGIDGRHFSLPSPLLPLPLPSRWKKNAARRSEVVHPSRTRNKRQSSPGRWGMWEDR